MSTALTAPCLELEELKIPRFLYGTAWKEEQTEALTTLALENGFRGIDTANQRKHYHEIGVGEALQKIWATGTLKREDLFLQTKFTYQAGQDHRLPYDPQANFATQVQQSFQSSLEHLHTDYLDAYVLHGPATRIGLHAPDWEVWQAMEELHQSQKVKFLGVSNIGYEQLRQLLERAKVKPRFVQNRCFARFYWDRQVRALCAAHGIVYQGFSLLTANLHELQAPRVRALADARQATIPQLVFLFALQLGMLPLTGTSHPEHMQQDLASQHLEPLAESELTELENLIIGT